MIGFMLNCLLPARAGEIARPAILYKKEKVSFSKVLATVGAERVFDVVVLLVSFVLVLVAVDISPNIHTSFGDYQLDRDTLHTLGMTTLQLCLLMIACIVFVSVGRSRMLMKRIILWLPELLFFAGSPFKEKVRDRVCSRLVRILDNIAAGLGLLKDPVKFGLCLGLSFVVWGAQGFSYYLMSLGCPGIGLSYMEMYASMVILCFFISLPSAPGFWGLWEAGGVFALLVFGVQDAEAAKGFTLMNHVFQMLPVIIIGVISAVITGVSVVEVAYADVEEQPANNAPELG
jgi:uncharacterized protein (TIRG00374 family)